MLDGPIGKIIFFWIFMIGAAFVGRLLGFGSDSRTMVIFLIACAIIYVVWVVGRMMAKRRREEQEYSAYVNSKNKKKRK